MIPQSLADKGLLLRVCLYLVVIGVCTMLLLFRILYWHVVASWPVKISKRAEATFLKVEYDRIKSRIALAPEDAARFDGMVELAHRDSIWPSAVHALSVGVIGALADYQLTDDERKGATLIFQYVKGGPGTRISDLTEISHEVILLDDQYSDWYRVYWRADKPIQRLGAVGEQGQ